MEADLDVTQMAYEGGNARYKGDANLFVRFFTSPVENKTKSKEAGRPIYEEREFIEIKVPGDKGAFQDLATSLHKNRFPEHYRKFKARIEQQDNTGTPISEWTGATRSQAEELKFFNINTVEQLVGAADSKLASMMGINALRDKARAYLEASGEQKASEELQAAKDEMAALKAQVAELMAKSEEDDADKPKRRGRPPKTE